MKKAINVSKGLTSIDVNLDMFELQELASLARSISDNGTILDDLRPKSFKDVSRETIELVVNEFRCNIKDACGFLNKLTAEVPSRQAVRECLYDDINIPNDCKTDINELRKG